MAREFQGDRWYHDLMKILQETNKNKHGKESTSQMGICQIHELFPKWLNALWVWIWIGSVI